MNCKYKWHIELHDFFLFQTNSGVDNTDCHFAIKLTAIFLIRFLITDPNPSPFSLFFF